MKDQTFGWAIEHLREGGYARRAGWNGKNMSIYLAKFEEYDPCIVMYTAQKTFQPGWLASQADILATDWEKVPHPDED